MELVNKNSEEQLIVLLAAVEKDPGAWINVHINMGRLNEQMFEREALSAQVLEDVRQSGVRMAKILMNSKLSKFEGKTFIFEDSDVIALFKKDESSHLEILEGLRRDFIRSGLSDILSMGGMQERLASLVQLSAAKRKTAEKFRHRQRAVEVAESIFTWTVPDMELARHMQEKRKGRSKGVILIIEDDIVARGIVALALRDKYDVVQAKDAKSGITAYVDRSPDVVFLDIHLPDHNGHEVLNRLKLMDPQAYVLMLSSDSVPENVVRAKHSGAAGFVRKPFIKDDILKYVIHCPALSGASSDEAKS